MKTHLTFVVEHAGGPKDRLWRLVELLAKGRSREVMTSVAGQTKRLFVKVCRRHVKGSHEGKPRVLRIRDLKGRFVGEASYDCDSSAVG